MTHALTEARTAEVASGRKLVALTLGSLGVVYGDIGTSPLYAFREALLAAIGGERGVVDAELVLGVLSLILWALMIVVTAKYVLILLRVHNRGEGGTLALMALAQRALGRPSTIVLILWNYWSRTVLWRCAHHTSHLRIVRYRRAQDCDPYA